MSMIEGIIEQVRAGLAENTAANTTIKAANELKAALVENTLKAIAAAETAQQLMHETEGAARLLELLGNISISAGSTQELLNQATEGSSLDSAGVLRQDVRLQERLAQKAFKVGETVVRAHDEVNVTIDEAVVSLQTLHEQLERCRTEPLDVYSGLIALHGDWYIRQLRET